MSADTSLKRTLEGADAASAEANKACSQPRRRTAYRHFELALPLVAALQTGT